MKTLIIVGMLLVSACATQPGQPPYWLKQYDGAPAAKQAACLAKARAAYSAQPPAMDMGFARVNMGKAWEACMG